MYNKIRNPKTQRMVSIHGKIGKQILQNYISFLLGGSLKKQTGGSDSQKVIKAVRVVVTASWCGPCKYFKAGGDNWDTLTEKEKMEGDAPAKEVIKNLRDNGETVYWLENDGNQTIPYDTYTKSNLTDQTMINNIKNAIQGYPTIMSIGKEGDIKYFDRKRSIKEVSDWVQKLE